MEPCIFYHSSAGCKYSDDMCDRLHVTHWKGLCIPSYFPTHDPVKRERANRPTDKHKSRQRKTKLRINTPVRSISSPPKSIANSSVTKESETMSDVKQRVKKALYKERRNN